MKKALSFFIFFGIFVNGVYAVDYTGSLPPSLTLPSGTNENSKAIASCNSWDCIFGNESGSFTYSTSGAGSSTLTLTATIPPNTTSVKTDTPFYYSTLTINSGSNLVLSGFSSLTIGNSININGGSLSFSNNTATSGFGMRANGRVTLNNARFEIKAGVFTNYGTITASNQSAIVLTSRGNYTNNYGTITNENSTVTVQYDLWNLGQKSGGASPSSIATITNNGGTITIGGNLYNGGQNSSSGVYYCQVGFCGGGNLIINGGSVKVGGQLISQQMDGQASSISIYGGTLEVGQGLQNKQGSTLTFGVLGGTMGKLQGSLTNSGTVVVDMNGVALNTSYQIITGAITGLDKDNIKVQHNNIAFLFVNYNNGTISLNTTSGGGGSGGGGGGGSGGDSGGGSNTQQSPFEQYKNSQSAVGKVFLNALSSRFGGDDNLIASDINIQNAVATAEQETTKALKDNYVSQPTKLINAFKGDLLSAPLRKSVRTSRRLAAGDFIRFDNGKRVNAFASKAS